MAKLFPTNYAPVTVRSTVAHLPGQKDGDKVKTGRDYSVEFDDALLSTEGWTNPRLNGCKIKSLFRNKFSAPGTPRQLGGIELANVEHLVAITASWEGDSGNLDQNPVVETFSNSIFFGATLVGFQEDKRFPNVGPDFSYLFLSKAYTFNPDDDTFFITELLGPEDDVFERVLKQDMRYASKFTFRLLDEGTEHDIQPEYTVHWNAGLFAELATYISCSETPFQHEMQLTSQYVGLNKNKDYYGLQFNPYLSNNYSQNNVPFFFNSNNRTIITGSFTINKNIDTWWWRRPKTSSFFTLTGTGIPPSDSASGATSFPNGGSHLHTSGDLSDSVFGFFFRLKTDFEFTKNPNENAKYGKAPAAQDLHIITFNDAANTVKEIQTELRYGKNTTQPLRHFGSLPISDGDKIPIPGSAVNQKTTLASSGFSLNFKSVGPAFEEFVVQEDAPVGAGSSHHRYFTFLVGGADPEGATHAYFSPPRPTGSGNFTGAPSLDKFTISKLIKRKNVIMADISKAQHLFDGIGGSGFLCIPENLNPIIKNNIDYFLKKAELIERGPNRKGVASLRPRILRTPKKIKPNWLRPDIGSKD